MFRAEKGSKRMELSGVRVECRSVGGFCDLPDLGAISVSRGAISAGWNILKFWIYSKTRNYICHLGTKLFDALSTERGS